MATKKKTAKTKATKKAPKKVSQAETTKRGLAALKKKVAELEEVVKTLEASLENVKRLEGI